MRHRAGKSEGKRSTGVAVVMVAGLASVLAGGCETDSFLFDPSVMGRWEHTPARVPVLSRIASIEGQDDEWVEYSDPTPADLIPEVSEYRIGPGDRLDITIYDLPDEGKYTPYQGKQVDTRGYIDIPQLGSINVNGLTVTEAVAAIQNAMKPLVTQPLAAIDVVQQRQQRFNVMGAVQNAGPYIIPVADYRLLEALTAAGGASESPEEIYIIRQVPLSEAAGGRSPVGHAPATGPSTNPPSGEQLNDLIRELSKPQPAPGTPNTNPPPPPKPEGAPAPTGTVPKPAGSPGVMSPSAGQPPAGQPAQPPAKPPIDLIEPGRSSTPPPPPPAGQPEPDTADATWVYLNGHWVKIKRPAPAQPSAGAEMQLPSNLAVATAAPVITQRVIRVPRERLFSGDARVNVVIRPGDIIRVPPVPSGNFFVAGQVSRPGVFQMSDRLTLTNALVAAGGLSQTAVPERADLTRMIGRDHVATIRLNVRAVFEGTEPDVFIKANDRINIGSNFWATPLAVIRNGFRASYGFGLIVDRNFGSDIFGIPPESKQNNGFF